MNNQNSHIQTFDMMATEKTETAKTNHAVETETAEMTMTATAGLQTEFELSLEDQFLDAEAIENELKAEVEGQEPLKAEAARLPSVLVDEQLLAELARIPDRFGFKIGDVADLLGIKQYVLRYWEEEFEILKPKKASNNQRLYTKKDVENAFLIRKLLYRDKFSIEGARQALKDVKFAVKKEKDLSSAFQKIETAQTRILAFVEEIRKTKSLFN